MKVVHKKETIVSKLLFYARRSFAHPERIPEFLYQTTRRILDGTRAGDAQSQERYYEQKIDRSARIDPKWAVGSGASTEWEAFGKQQFEYLAERGPSEDSYVRRETIQSALKREGFSVEVMSDWEHQQTKIRARSLEAARDSDVA